MHARVAKKKKRKKSIYDLGTIARYLGGNLDSRSVKRLEIGNVLIFTVGIKAYLEIIDSQALGHTQL